MKRKAFTLVELLVVIMIIGMLIAILMPAAYAALEQANRLRCSSNLNQIGKACQTYASAHKQKWPDAYQEDSETWEDVGNTRTDEYDPVDAAAEPESGEAEDNDDPVNSNTASLYLLVRQQIAGDPRIFVCPSSDFDDDPNLVDYTQVRDFRGENYITYSYQNVLGGYQIKSTADPQLAVAADVNPLRRDYEDIVEREMEDEPRFEVSDWGDIQNECELNSPNHDFKGQNVLFLDGHVEFFDNPYCGARRDNIWVPQQGSLVDGGGSRPEDPPDPSDIETIRAYDNPDAYSDTQSKLKPGIRDDSFLVP